MRKLLPLLLLVLMFVPAHAQPAKPKLVVVLVVDQMRADYLTRYGGLYEHGFKTLTSQGAWYRKAAYPYFMTVTCVGHTTIGTGELPFHHGMIGNAWYHRDTGKAMTCNDDPDTAEVSYGAFKGTSDSAKWMMAPTLAETMRETAKSKVATMSIKARSAIGLAGHEGDFVTWLDERGAWTTSSAYETGPSGWFSTFVQANPLDHDANKTWDRLLPPDRYLYDDAAPGEQGSAGWGATFPHKLGAVGADYIAHWVQSPFADEYLEQMAEAAVTNMELGHEDNRTDFLGVSFSTLDVVGHAYGPRSHEVQDVLVRLDATIGKLLAFLDEKVGAERYVVALSADHGVADIPEQVPGAGRVIVPTVRATVEAAVKTALGGEGPFLAAVNGSDLYFKPGIYDQLKQKAGGLESVTTALTAIPGVARVLTGDEQAAESARTSKDAHLRAAALSYFPGRSGDLLIVPKENWILTGAGTTHGSWYPYDQDVPIIFYGAGIAAGTHDNTDVSPADIAPTLGSIVGARLPSPDGHVLTTALKK